MDADSQFNLSLTETILSEITDIYIDWLYLQDLYLGAIIDHIQTPEQYRQVLAHLPEYNARITNTHAEYFPEMGLDEAYLTRYIADPKNAKRLLLLSPFNTLYQLLPRLLSQIISRNQQFANNPLGSQITYYLNVHPLTLIDSKAATVTVTDEMCLIKARMLNLDPTGKIALIHTPPTETTPELFRQISVAFIYDLVRFLQTEGTSSSDAFCKQLLFQNTCVFAPKRVDDPNRCSGKDLEDAFTNTEAVLNCHCNFFYLNTGIKLAPSAQEVS